MELETWEVFVLGMLVAWTPALVVLALILWRTMERKR